jgi:hypothetical protein
MTKKFKKVKYNDISKEEIFEERGKCLFFGYGRLFYVILYFSLILRLKLLAKTLRLCSFVGLKWHISARIKGLNIVLPVKLHFSEALL